MNRATTLRIEPARRPFRASVDVPGDKSLSHRALIFASMAPGTSIVRNAGPGADVASTGRVLQALGVEIEGEAVRSPGIEGWRPASGPLDAGNSGTTLRVMAGALAGRPFSSTLTGDESLRRRPMERLVAPLAALGAEVTTTPPGVPPVTVGAPRRLVGTKVVLPLASAQVRTAFALAALQAEGPSEIVSPPGFRDHTERWLEFQGRGTRMSERAFRIEPGPLEPGRFDVPGDPSSAAFLWASAAILPGASVTTPGVSLNPGRIGFLQILEMMGAHIEAQVTGAVMGDPVGTVTVTGRGLRGVEIGGALAIEALDELPLVGVLGAYAEGITVVRDAAELRAKETDRIAATVALVRGLGGGAEAASDGFSVLGTGWLDGGIVDPTGDHRIAMAAAVAATAATGPVEILYPGVASVSWPHFYEVLETAWSSR